MKENAVRYRSGENVQFGDRVRIGKELGKVIGVVRNGEVVADDYPREHSVRGPMVTIYFENGSCRVVDKMNDDVELISRGDIEADTDSTKCG
jgi:hypothetical protein